MIWCYLHLYVTERKKAPHVLRHGKYRVLTVLSVQTWHLSSCNFQREPISDYWVSRLIEILRFAQNDVSILVILKERQRLKNLDQALEKLEAKGCGGFSLRLNRSPLTQKFETGTNMLKI